MVCDITLIDMSYRHINASRGPTHLIANLDKKQYLDPRAFGDSPTGTRLLLTKQGTLTTLGVLLAAEADCAIMNLAGAFVGSTTSEVPLVSPAIADLVGSWAGNRIAMVLARDGCEAARNGKEYFDGFKDWVREHFWDQLTPEQQTTFEELVFWRISTDEGAGTVIFKSMLESAMSLPPRKQKTA